MHGIVTESMFPLDQREENVSVIVEDWSDLSEPPSQVIARLTDEVNEITARHQAAETALRNHVDAMAMLDEYVIERTDARLDNGHRTVRHAPCGTAVATLPIADSTLGQVVATATKHDCSIGALIATKGKISQFHRQMIDAARGLCAGTPDNADSEYMRGVAEMLCDTLSLPMDRKDEVAAWLAADE